MTSTIFEELRRQEKENRKRAIVVVAEEILRESGLEAITIRNVAKKAGLSSGSIYMYFKNKEELLLSMLIQNLNILKKDMMASVDAQNPLGAIRKIAYHYKSYFIRFGKYINIQGFSVKEDGGFKDIQSDMMAELDRLLAELLDLVQEILSTPEMQGPLKGLPPERGVPVLWALIQGLVQISLPTRQSENTYFDFDQLMEDVTHILA